jgi:putative phage-type endonuclease
MNNPLQGTAAWHSARCGKLSASRMAAAMSFLKNGQDSADRRKLKIELLAERMTGEAFPHFVNDAMRHGLDNEPEAKLAYEAATGRMIMPVGFIEHPNIHDCGASPDGLVETEGLIETKCPTTGTHIAWVIAGVVPDEYMPQMTLQLACTRRRWCDFVSYDPRVPEPQRLFVRRFTPTPEQIEGVEEAAKKFLRELDELWERVTTAEMVA